MDRESRDGYREQIVTCDVDVSAFQDTVPPLFMKYSNGTNTQCYAYQYLSLLPVLFYNPYLLFAPGIQGRTNPAKLVCVLQFRVRN